MEPKRTKAYTTTSGERVTKFDDGTETRASNLNQDTFAQDGGVYQTSKNGSATLVGGKGAPTLPPPPKIQPSVTATDLATPPPTPQPPIGTAPTIPNRVNTTVNNVLGSIRSQSENTRKLEEEMATFGALGGQSGFDIQSQQLEKYGVTPEKLKRLEDIQLQLADRKTSSELTKARIEGAPGQGIAQSQREVTQEDKEQAIRDTSLAAEAAILQGNIETGRALAKDAVDIALSDREFNAKTALEQIDYYQGIVDEETAQLLEAEKRGYEAEKEKIDELKDWTVKAIEAGATQSQIARLNDPNVSDEEKISLAQSVVGEKARYVAPETFSLGKGESRYRVNADGTVELIAGGAQTTPSQVSGQGGDIFSVLEASSQYDKTLEASERQNITKAMNVAGQLNNLSDLVNLDSETYGPLVGQLRGINPFDTNAQEFKAIIQGIVPNLARGIYGEVGVLTDQDIENYAKTLPTLGSTEEVQDAMLGLTLKLVRDSVRNQLTIAAESGINVSGLTNTVERLDKMVGESLTPITMKSDEVNDLVEAGADRAEIEGLLREGYDITDVENYYMGGGPSSGESVSFNDAITASADAIAAVESGGNYQAMGPIIPSGQYAGDQAMGKYQIMSFNIPSWSKEALGYEVSPQEFLSNPQLQDQIFAYKFGQHAKKYGTLEDAASAWFSGQPLASAGGRQDVLGTSVPEYVRKFQENLKLYA
jgi:hypothetical protein